MSKTAAPHAADDADLDDDTMRDLRSWAVEHVLEWDAKSSSQSGGPLAMSELLELAADMVRFVVDGTVPTP